MSAKQVKVRLQSQSHHVVARGGTYKELLLDCKQKLQINPDTSVQLVFESNLQIINDENFNTLTRDEELVLQRRDHDLVAPAESTSSFSEDKSRGKSKSIVLEHKRNYVGEIIYKGHPSWVLMQNIQTGIRHYVGKSSQVILQADLNKLNPQDQELFKSPKALAFPPNGSAETQPHKTGLFKFKDYCPLAFRHLRQKFGIDPADYMVSLCNTLEDGQNALRELPTPGKSGSLFFFSHDMKYIIKTIPKREAKLLRTLLPEYYKHVMENINTLLPKFFGLCRVKPHGGRQVRFVIMGNVFATNKKIHSRYDLKGSLVGRAASEGEIARFHENVTYKDIDWRNQRRKLILNEELKNSFLEQLKKDCALLEKLNIMDYSLLVGVHDCSKNDGRDCSLACAFRQLHNDNNHHTQNTKFREKRKKKRRKEEKKTEDQPTEHKEQHDNASEVAKQPPTQPMQESQPQDAPQTSESSQPKQEPVPEQPKEKPAEPEPQAEPPKIEQPNNNNNTQPAEESHQSTPPQEAPIDSSEEPSRKFSITSISSRSSKGKEKIKESSESRDSIPGWLNSLRLKGSGNGTARKMPSGPKAQTSYPLPEKYKTISPSIFQQDDGGIKSAGNDDEYYFVGIIDILMLYTIKKWAEHAIKSIRFESDEISSINPQDYSHRFQDFIGSQLMTPHEFHEFQQQNEHRSSSELKQRSSTEHKRDPKNKLKSSDQKDEQDHKHNHEEQEKEHEHKHHHNDQKHPDRQASSDSVETSKQGEEHHHHKHEHTGEEHHHKHEHSEEHHHKKDHSEEHHHHKHEHSEEHHHHKHHEDDNSNNNKSDNPEQPAESLKHEDPKDSNGNAEHRDAHTVEHSASENNSSPHRKEKKSKKAKKSSPRDSPKNSPKKSRVTDVTLQQHTS